jgi:hypothetical protein
MYRWLVSQQQTVYEAHTALHVDRSSRRANSRGKVWRHRALTDGANVDFDFIHSSRNIENNLKVKTIEHLKSPEM